MEGFIKLYRQLRDWEWYKDGNTMRVFIHLLISANHKPGRWKGIEIGRGQFLTGRKSLALDLDLTEQEIRTAINKLKSTNEITSEATSTYTLYTLQNYDLYQSQTTSEATNEQPTSNQRATTNKNENNNNNKKNIEKNINKKKKKWETEKKEEKIEIISKVFLTPEEDKKVREKYGSHYKEAIEKLSNYINSKGAKYVSHYHVFNGWLYDDFKKRYADLWRIDTELEKKNIEEQKQKEAEKKEKQARIEAEKRVKELENYYRTLPKSLQEEIIALAENAFSHISDEARKKYPDNYRNFVQGKRRSITEYYKNKWSLPTS